MARHTRPFSPVLTARLAVLAIATSTAYALLGLGIDPITTAWTTLLGVAGAVEVSCRLTEPAPAPKTRTAVVVVILVFIVRLLATGFPPAPALLLVLAGAAVLTEIARRLTGLPYRLPRFSY
jgi:uncharacterized membrane protein